ncbi:MAG TPA: glutaredoxin [Cytophagales bacterium]|jgi:arsenate reductase|nr:glutaredoxin [Cytophagales bacterium]
MKHNKNEVWIYYDSSNPSHKRVKAMAYSISKHVHDLDLNCNEVSNWMWKDILDLLHMQPKQLLNKADRKYQEELRGHDFDEEDWLEILHKNPKLLKGPIAIHGDKAVLCVNPNDVYKIA